MKKSVYTHTNQNRLRIRTVIFGLLVCTILAAGQGACDLGDGFGRFVYEAVYADSLMGPDSAAVHIPVSLRITGTLPDPSWAFDHFDVSAASMLLTIQPVGRHDLELGPVPMVVIEFDRTLTHAFTRVGTWTVRVEHRAGTIQREIYVHGGN